MPHTLRSLLMVSLATVFLASWLGPGATAAPLPGGTLDPTAVPKYVIPLVIPPVMNDTNPANGVQDKYEIAVRQFKQQILPGGIWNLLNGRSDNYSPTQVWSYGPAADPTPTVAPDPASQFNYPAYTVESVSHVPVDVRWINDLKDPQTGEYLPHLLPVDQTLHWANPAQQCADGSVRTDCAGTNPEHYKGPVPMVVHVHGAHVEPHSDGFPEAWWLPAATNIPAGYATHGKFFDDVSRTNPGNLGYADFSYRNDQPATTLWYHDHSLGMTRSNVYAGPAGFWLVRGGIFDGAGIGQTLPAPAPAAGEGVVTVNFPAALGGQREKYREIPIAIQDRSFDKNGAKLFYPKKRAFFEGVASNELKIDFAPFSDVPPTWQPEAFFNVMVVNGVSWPRLDVAQALYRFRLLNGCNSRFLNLSLFVVNPDDTLGEEIPFYQIGAEEGFLDKVVRIKTGESTPLPGDGTSPDPFTATIPPEQALLMGNAERADVIVDFRGLPGGTVVRMVNTGPDEPFGGFPAPVADSGTTGQVMQFVVDAALNGQSPTDPGGANPATDPLSLALRHEGRLGASTKTWPVSLNEESSAVVCVLADAATGAFLVPIRQVDCLSVPPAGTVVAPFGPTMAKLGILDDAGNPIPLNWDDPTTASAPKAVMLQNGVQMTVKVTENPTLNRVEEFEIRNFTEDAHPIHLHMVRFNVVGREPILGGTSVSGSNAPQPAETGYKDTVIAYPGEVTRVKAMFDIEGLFVWHCHIVEHEDNEMMRPYVVSP